MGIKKVLGATGLIAAGATIGLGVNKLKNNEKVVENSKKIKSKAVEIGTKGKEQAKKLAEKTKEVKESYEAKKAKKEHHNISEEDTITVDDFKEEEHVSK